MEREVLKKSLVLVSISFFFMMTFFIFDHGFSLTGFAIFSESGSSFDNGTYVNTTYNGTGVVLSGSSLTGYYESQVYDAGNEAYWNNASFNSVTIADSTSYLSSAVHSGSNLSAFFSLDDFYYLADMKDENKKIFLNFSTSLVNNTVLHIYAKLSKGVTVGIYDISDTSGSNPLGTFTVTSSTGEWYNVTLSEIPSSTDALWIGEGVGSGLDPKEEFDFIFASTTGSTLTFEFRSCSLANCNDGVWESLDVQNLNKTSRYFQYRVNFSRGSDSTDVLLYNSTLDYTLVNEAPDVNIVLPQSDTTYGYNESIALNFSARDINDNLDSCWYSINGGANVSISDCLNTTFDVSGDGSYTLMLYANDSLGEVGSDSVSFSVTVGAPTIILHSPYNVFLDNASVTFVYTPDDIDLEACSLYGNFTGVFALNQTDVTPINQSQNSFSLNLSDGFYKWNVLCNDSLGNSAFNGNKTFVVDTTNPSAILVQPSGQKSSRVVSMDFTPFDVNLDSCFYSVYRGGTLEIANTSVSCFAPGSFNVTVDADFVFHLYLNDSAGNIISKNTSFSVDTSSSPPSVPSSGGSGGSGGGGGSSFFSSSFNFSEFNLEIETLRGILIPLEEKSLYVTVKNTGRSAVNKCQIRSDDPDNFESSLRTNIASGEIIDFPVIIRVIDSIPRLYIECVEGTKDLPLDFVIYEKTLDATISQIDLGSGEIILSYTLRSDFGFNDAITFEVKNSQGALLNSITEDKSFGSNESYVGEVVIPLSDEATGLLTVSILLDDTVLVDDTIIYGDSIITGLVSQGIFGDMTSIFVWLLFGMFNIFAFFVIRRVWTNTQHMQQEVSSV